MPVVLSFLPNKGDVMNPVEKRDETPKKASISLPQYLWDALEKDAKRCRRSVTKHIESILSLYYGLETSVNIDEDAVTAARDMTPHRQQQKKIA